VDWRVVRPEALVVVQDQLRALALRLAEAQNRHCCLRYWTVIAMVRVAAVKDQIYVGVRLRKAEVLGQ
jgi:dimeric dUTPase (all-alpha-NTP-PPase superfamily)